MSLSSRGGSELMYEAVVKGLGLGSDSPINLIWNLAHPKMLREGKCNVLWTQHNWNQPSMGHLRDPELINRFDAFIFVSNWQLERYRNIYKIPGHKSYVIPNAIKPLDANKRDKSEPLRLLYASTPWRGLEVLLDAFENLGRDDVVLDVFSSTKIYGAAFHEANYATYKPLFERASATRNVFYRDYQPNEVVREAIQNAQILAYPSVFEETSCITAIESGSAGLYLVVTNYGALFETCGPWASYTTYQDNHKALALEYKKSLGEAVSGYWSEPRQKQLNAQKEFFDYFYNINSRLNLWRRVLNQIQESRAY